MGSNFRECFHWFLVLCRGTPAAPASAMAGGGWIWELSCVRSAVCFCFVCVFICHFSVGRLVCLVGAAVG